MFGDTQNQMASMMLFGNFVKDLEYEFKILILVFVLYTKFGLIKDSLVKYYRYIKFFKYKTITLKFSKNKSLTEYGYSKARPERDEIHSEQAIKSIFYDINKIGFDNQSIFQDNSYVSNFVEQMALNNGEVKTNFIPTEFLRTFCKHSIHLYCFYSRTTESDMYQIELKATDVDMIEKYIKYCINKYNEEIIGKVDIGSSFRNYIYFPTITTNPNPTFDRFYYKDHKKTMDNVFLNEKNLLVKHIQDYKNEKINKIQLMLYGPPGTGKTSLIKALANELDASIVYIKLEEVKNFKNLFYIINSDNYTLNTWKSVVLKPENKIFVFEDFDITYKRMFVKRDLASTTTTTTTTVVTEGTGTGIDGDAKIKLLGFTDEEITTLTDTQKTKILAVNTKLEAAKKEPEVKTDLKLSDLLQIFDGIIEKRNIMIMTTNDISVFDPAMIRAGRVTLKMNLGILNESATIEMIESIYNTKKNKSFHDDIKFKGFTPSRLEYYCSNYCPTIEDYKTFMNEKKYETIDI